MTTRQVSASYEAPNGKEDFSYDISALPVPSDAQDVTAYLSTLRKKVAQLQTTINTTLTQKMEEDKTAANGGSDSNGTAAAIDEQKEEDNYGEEVEDDD